MTRLSCAVATILILYFSVLGVGGKLYAESTERVCENGACATKAVGSGLPRCYEDEDCGYDAKHCDPLSQQCLAGAIGIPCKEDGECSHKACIAGRCEYGGKGASCNSDGDCSQKRCQDGLCMKGGRGRPCQADGVCQQKRCFGTDAPKCGIALNTNADTTNRPRCAQDTDCENETMWWREHKLCFGGTCRMRVATDPKETDDSRWCSSSADCAWKTCDVNGRCIAGGPQSGRLCSSDQECTTASLKHCRFNPNDASEGSVTCALNGNSSAHCESADDCVHKACVGDGDTLECRLMRQPGKSQCQEAEDCAKLQSKSRPKNSLHRSLARLDKAQKAKVEELIGLNPVFGRSSAPVTFVMFQDLKCGMCKKSFRETIQKLRTDFVDKGLVRLVMVDFPLGAAAVETALASAARCAYVEDRYFEFVGLLYDNIKKSRPEDLPRFGKQAGIKDKSFLNCVASERFKPVILSNVAAGVGLGIDGTPHFFVNDLIMTGAQPYQNFVAAIESELGKHTFLP